MDLSCNAFIGLKDNSSSLASLWFYSKKGFWILLNGFLASIEILVWFMSLNPFMQNIMFIDLCVLNFP